MKIFVLFIIFYTQFIFASFEGRLFLGQDKIQVGEIVHAQLELKLEDHSFVLDPLSLKQKMISESLYILDVKNIHRSKNNSDLILADLDLVITRYFDPVHELHMNIDSLNVKITIKSDVVVEKFKGEIPENFVILPNLLSRLKDWKFLIGLTVILLLLLFFLYKKLKPTKNKVIFDKKIAAENLIVKVQNITDRAGFESIVNDLKIYIKKSNSGSNFLNEYLKILNIYQFKKEWAEEEFQEMIRAKEILVKGLRSGI